MPRLSEKAWKILVAEVECCTAKSNLAEKVQRDIVLKRLQKLRTGSGSPATEAELRHVLSDIFPNFSRKALKAAAKANQPPGPFTLIPGAVASLAGIVGLIWTLNLPYPMIRRPVARTIPIVLLPSYLSMDRNYREAIAHFEQADQLVNHATSLADFELGEEKVQATQKNLDALPVWFLGYEPKAYCRFFGCSWHFTLDEFREARASIGRMEVKIFQEKNALAQLEEWETALLRAKQQYYQAETSPQRQMAIAQWQTAIDKIQQLPPSTLAGEMAQNKLSAYQRDFQKVANF